MKIKTWRIISLLIFISLEYHFLMSSVTDCICQPGDHDCSCDLFFHEKIEPTIYAFVITVVVYVVGMFFIKRKKS